MTSIKLSAALPAADTITLLAEIGRSGPSVCSVLKSAATTKKIEAAAKSMGFSGKAGEVATLPGSLAGVTASVQVVGIGDAKTHETVRRSLGNAARALKDQKRWVIVVPDEHLDAVGAISDGALLGTYPVRNAKTGKQPVPVASITLVSKSAADPVAKAAVERSQAVCEAVQRTRNLANTPPNELPPAAIATFARKLAKDFNLQIQVLDEKQLKAKGFGGITGVGQGSSRPPRLIRLAYRPAKAVGHLSIVGKGITFDTGGISLKPPLNMHEMKADMSGAAAVINAIAAIAELGVPLNVTAYAACAENMPGGNAQRPGDVVKAYGGKTVEVLNTDAEGRLVLMDALVRAAEDRPDVIVDIATLTGACGIALGSRMSGVLSPHDDLRNHVVDAASRCGEMMWPLPLPVEYRPNMDSQVADIANIGTPALGGTLYGGLFLQEFVDAAQPWAHIDIAPPAFNSGAPYDYSPKGATGAGVRTLVTLAEDMAAGLLKL